jgi:hypothetical protein
MFSYIIVDRGLSDTQEHIPGIYTFSTNDLSDRPVSILRSSTPSITAKIYAGNPFPDFDYTQAIERRVKLDIQAKLDYGVTVAAQINDPDWHLHAGTTSSVLEIR